MTPENRQASFAAALQDPARPVPAGIVSYRGDSDPLRFAVYRNNVHIGLLGVLAAKFPVCVQLVGDDFFRAMARIYIADHKPGSPVMMLYGADFPEFIASFQRARAVPYLADIAQLEQAWSIAYNGADQASLAIDTLAALTPDALLASVLSAHPASGLIVSPFPIGTIWSAHQSPGVPITPGAESVLLTRPDADVKVTVIPAADAIFLSALLGGQSIGTAAQTTLAAHASFDLAQALTGLCALGAFSSSREG